MKSGAVILSIICCILWLGSLGNATVPPADPVDAAMRARIKTLLKESWEAYKQRFIQEDGRVMDRSTNMITTSEGQSYAMLRAVWQNDPATFDKTWRWSVANLKRSDKLFSWKWGERQDKTWGVLETESATDADEDIAYALLLAGNLWNKPEYTEAAKAIITDIWDKEVAQVNWRPYLTAGPWAKNAKSITLNPSYFAPYEYRLFAKVDPAHNWMGVVETSYDVLNKVSSLSRLELPSDWCLLEAQSGQIVIERDSPKSDYSYDAFRVPWRIAADFHWFRDKRAEDYLKRLSFLVESFKLTRTIRGAYTAGGVMRSFDEPLAGFGAALPLLGILDPEVAKQVAQEKILSVNYNGVFRGENDYYGNNWAWFGLALYADDIPAPPTL